MARHAVPYVWQGLIDQQDVDNQRWFADEHRRSYIGHHRVPERSELLTGANGLESFESNV